MNDDKDLTADQRAKIASRAQALAHKALREAHPEEYREAYQEAKRRLSGGDRAT